MTPQQKELAELAYQVFEGKVSYAEYREAEKKFLETTQ
jgi:hypothetical protein